MQHACEDSSDSEEEDHEEKNDPIRSVEYRRYQSNQPRSVYNKKRKYGPEMNPSGPVPAWAWPTCLLHLVQNGDLKLGTNLPARSNSKA